VTLRVKLSRKAKSHFRRRHPARLTLRLKVTEGGSTTTKTKRVKVT
jgi:hypothetical protein